MKTAPSHQPHPTSPSYNSGHNTLFSHYTLPQIKEYAEHASRTQRKMAECSSEEFVHDHYVAIANLIDELLARYQANFQAKEKAQDLLSREIFPDNTGR